VAGLQEEAILRMMVDLNVPDSSLAREVEELLRTASPAFLTNHSFRSHAWSVALAQRDGVRFDVELLYVAALLHDVGLLAPYDTGRCFEEDGAQVAAQLASAEGWSAERVEAVAEAIRLHTAVEISIADGPEAYLLWHATGLDVTGHRYEDIDAETIAAVVSAYPRLDFVGGFTELVADQAARKSGCWANRAIGGGLAAHIAAAPFEAGATDGDRL
jgi:HD superfamily phosphodiesterase